MLLIWDNATRRRSQERVLIGADNPVARGDVKRKDKRREKETWREERKRERRESNKNKTWKNKTGRTTTLMRAMRWPTQGSPFPGSSCSLVGEDNFCSVAGPLRRRKTLVTASISSSSFRNSRWSTFPLAPLYLSVHPLCVSIIYNYFIEHSFMRC